MMKQYLGYTGLNKILKLSLPISFYFLTWLLKDFKLHMRLVSHCQGTVLSYMSTLSNFTRVCGLKAPFSKKGSYIFLCLFLCYFNLYNCVRNFPGLLEVASDCH